MEWKADSRICECCSGRSEQLKHLKMGASNLPASRVGPSGGRTLLRTSLPISNASRKDEAHGYARGVE